MLGDERFVQGGEFFTAFDGEADGTGEAAWGGEAVTGGIGGGTRFAFGRDRPLGFFPVGTGGGTTATG